MSELDLKTYDRRPFSVTAVQLTLANIDAVAEWCSGRADMTPTKMMGTEALLPCVKVPGQGTAKGHEFTCNIGSYIVEFKGSYRVYKPIQFRTTFVERSTEENGVEAPAIVNVELPDVADLTSSI